MRDVGRVTIVNTKGLCVGRCGQACACLKLAARGVMRLYGGRPVGRKSAAGKQKTVFGVNVQKKPIVFETHAEK